MKIAALLTVALLAGCTEKVHDRSQPTDVVSHAAEEQKLPVRHGVAAPIAAKPHPAQMAMHCLRVLASADPTAHEKSCRQSAYWAAVSKQRGPISDQCLLVRLVLEANNVATEEGIVPASSLFLPSMALKVNDCNIGNEFLRIAPYAASGVTTAAEKIDFVKFALRAIGEDQEWSTFPTIEETDRFVMCKALRVATVPELRSEAKDALGCQRWWSGS